MTAINFHFPMMIVQNRRYATSGFKYLNRKWVRKFTIEPRLYEIRNAFGPFFIAKSLKDRTIKLLELGGRLDTQIVTEMQHGPIGSDNFVVDAVYDREEFALSYERNRCHVIWSRFQ